MNWHLIIEVALWTWLAVSLPASIRMARAGVFRRVWNWPMRIGIACWLFGALFSGFADWATHRNILGSNLPVILRELLIPLFSIGFVSMAIFLAGFLRMMLRNLRSPVDSAVDSAVMAPIDRVQELILRGKEDEAIRLYQDQMGAGQAESVAAVHQIASSLKAGLRV